MNLSLILLCLAQLESSGGKNMNHPQPENHGWYGQSDLAITDINRHYGTDYTAQDCKDKLESRFMANLYIAMYIREDWTVRDVIAFWRCGVKGMRKPTEKQIAYVDHGMRMYTELVQGNEEWRSVK